MAPFDVILAKVRVGESFKPRFCVVLEALPDGSVRILPCSSSFEQCRDGVDFEIHDYLDEFPATGFVRSSYVIEDDMQLVSPDRIGKRRGSLTGDLRQRFAVWAGV
ncbi:MAG: hypothetical protein ACYTKD_06165 [Planctomycetota bacterium]